jgi:hypothetical protein
MMEITPFDWPQAIRLFMEFQVIMETGFSLEVGTRFER